MGETNNPRHGRHRIAFRELIQEHGAQYTAVIEAAAELKSGLQVADQLLDVHNTHHIGHRFQALWQLRGIQSAAAEMLMAAAGQLDPRRSGYPAADELAKQHIASMAAAIEQDDNERLEPGLNTTPLQQTPEEPRTNQRARWTLIVSQQPNGLHDSRIELSDADRENIATLITANYTEGEITQAPPGDHELVWRSADTEEPDDQNADSVHRIAPEATSAYYSLGPGPLAPGEDGERWWGLELIQMNDGNEIGGVSLGSRHADEQTAKDYAQRWERHGRTYPV